MKFLFQGKTLMYIAFLHWPFIFNWFMSDVWYFLLLMVPTVLGFMHYFSLAYRFYWSDRKKRLLIDSKNKRIVYGQCTEIKAFEYSDICKIIKIGSYVSYYIFVLKDGYVFSISELIMRNLDKSLWEYWENVKPFANYAGKPEMFISSKSYL